MKKFIITTSFVFVSLLSNAQSIEANLKKDLVKVENAKIIIEEQFLVKIKDESIQIKAHCEAPENTFISRDKFVYYSGVTIQSSLESLLGDDVEIENLDEIVGSADIEVNCYMAKTGLQIEIKADGKTTKSMMKWADIL